MEKNPYNILNEIVFSSSEKSESKKVSKLLREGRIRKIAPKIYTSNMSDLPENIVRRNLFFILGHLYSKAVISHRSAFEFKPTNEGHFYLTYSYTKNISLPGITLHLLEGAGGQPEDTPFIEGLYLSRQERAFLENLQISKTKGEKSKTLPRKEIEEKLERIITANGEEALNELRDKAKVVAEQLNMQYEFKQLDNIIGALLSTRDAKNLTSSVAKARAAGVPFDPNRVELFHILFAELQSREFPYIEDRNITTDAYRTFAFFESYFSNYIEGTEFELEDALEIVRTNTPMPARHDDSHDVLGTFYIVSNREEMSRTPQTAQELIDILKARHRVLMSARQSKMPGMFKDRNNRAGNTDFVDWTLVRGTLYKGFEYYNALKHPFAKAVFMMFMVSEVHPFLDGNGRMSRVMMNAELTRAGQSKIIIPTVFRDDYLGALRKLTRSKDASVLVNAMIRVQNFSSNLIGEDTDSVCSFLQKSNAFESPDEAMLLF